MMKRLIVLLLLSAVLWGCVSPWMGLEKAFKEEKTMQIIYELPGTSKETLFDRTLQWMNAKVIPKGGNIVYQDRTRESITARVMTSYKNLEVPVPSRYTMRVDFKDGRIRVTCYDFEDFWGEFRKTARPVEDADFIKQLKENAREMGDALNAYLKGGTPSTDAEW